MHTLLHCGVATATPRWQHRGGNITGFGVMQTVARAQPPAAGMRTMRQSVAEAPNSARRSQTACGARMPSSVAQPSAVCKRSREELV